MGANTSKHRYEYSYGNAGYDPYARSRAMGYVQGAPYYGNSAGMMPAGYPTLQAPAPMLVPFLMQPVQQISGLPIGQAQQVNLQPQMQQQPAMQMPQPQVQLSPGNPLGIPPSLVPPAPGSQMPQPELQAGVQPQPQPQHPLSPPRAMPERGQAMTGTTPIMPRYFTRAPSRSSSGSSSSTSRPRRRRRRRGRDPLEHNPLPAPPREVEAPDDLLAGTAMAPRGPPLPRSPSPLKNPLPLPPRDVYTLRKYRPLLIGTAYADREKEVYPRGWFEDEERSDREGGLGRVLERLNPFRPHRDSDFSPRHRRSETMPVLSVLPEFERESSGSTDSTYASPGARRAGLGRAFSSRLPFGRRRRGDEQMMPMPAQGDPSPLADGQPAPVGFMPMPSPVVPGPTDQPQPAHPLSPGPPFPQPANPLNPSLQQANPLTPGPSMPQPVNPLTPNPQPAGHLTPGPPQTMPMPTPAQPFSPILSRVAAGEGPRSPSSASDSTLPVIRFTLDTPGYGDLTHLSSRRVLYRNKLYPTAAHLFEAHRFLGMRDDLASRVRRAETLPELGAVLSTIEEYTRPDWEEVLIDKMEEALYYKIVQHEDLCEMLLNTGVAELIYAEPTDPFWGEGEHEEGTNELGRALMRIRDRLKREAEGH